MKANFFGKCRFFAGMKHGCILILLVENRLSSTVFRIIRIFTGDTSNDFHSPGPVIWETSP